MSYLHGKHILLGVTGGIAAYKTAHLTRLLIKAGAEVKIILTPNAREFVTPLTLSTLSKNPVLTSFTKDDGSGVWNSHVELGLWADYMIIAPATANTLSKMASGEADNLLIATYLSARCPVFIAPAMDLDMYRHHSTVQNLETLIQHGRHIIPAEEGELASGLTGEGRMAEPENILAFLNNYIEENAPLYGKKILITAGPTYEPIDPVRYIGNRSSGKMGFALAENAAQSGAEVILVTGPVHLPTPPGNVKRIDVETAAEMYRESMKYFPGAHIVIAAAAVADFTPVKSATHKIKKQASGKMTLNLTHTKDILAEMGKRKKHQLLAGFALETQDGTANAQKKLSEKNLDLIILNSLQDEGAGFGHDTNVITLIDRDGSIRKFPKKTKKELATDIINHILTYHA